MIKLIMYVGVTYHDSLAYVIKEMEATKQVKGW